MHHRAIPQRLELEERKVVLGDLQLLKTDDIGSGARQPVEDAGKPDPNRVDVPGRDLHRSAPNALADLGV
jgi:hypothetical protein